MVLYLDTSTLVENKSQSVKVSELQDILTINEKLMGILVDGHSATDEMCDHLINAGGKRLRPLLVLYSGLLFSGPKEILLQAAAAAEFTARAL